MKASVLAVLALLLLIPARAEPPAPVEFPRLETLAGKVYEKAKVTRVELDVAILAHAGGVARVEAADLAEEVRAQIPFDLEGAAKKAAETQAGKQREELVARWKEGTNRLFIGVKQVLPDGVIATLSVDGFPYGDLHFVELDPKKYDLTDGESLQGLRGVKLEEPYVYETVFGARATIPRWRIVTLD
ncbi:MAG TPA: hypothetical protein PLA50_00945 [Bacteroidia bacterium]|nr:hypothetical protein [Bacteroidia bacterium]